MDIKRNTKVKVTGVVNANYPHDLQFYGLPPDFDITLIELRRLAFERLKILRIIEEVTLRGRSKYSKEWTAAILNELRKQGLKKYATLFSSSGALGSSPVDEDARRDDHTSHYILRLSYCNSEQHQMWFMARELELFRLRFGHLSQEGVQSFVEQNKLSFSVVSPSEKEQIFTHLMNCTPHMTSAAVEVSEYYKFQFNTVPDLVRNRRVYLQNGVAYVPSGELLYVVLHMYRGILARGLKALVRIRASLDSDPRLGALMSGLHVAYTGRDYSNTPAKENSILPQELDQFCLESFPPCMQQLHQQLRATHHLHHSGRLRYILYLKGLGLSYEHAMEFFRDEFMQHDAKKFEKEYSYIINHSYGKVGACKQYSPYSCSKLITETLGEGSCPFKFEASNKIKALLTSHDSHTPEYVQTILQFVEAKQYCHACTKYFEMTHKVEPGSIINHPVQYFEESRQIRTGKEIKGAARKPQTTRVSVPSSQSDTSGTQRSEVENIESIDFGEDDFSDYNIS
ncbi:DNA primase large subunit-like [Ischnura elegans]|uniref:DNA primase large subunit-like n=1 Tax=Ischnura elegans TaxID=197161 RepID=UPI001ED8825F|nr:DNA primase large subunit-like [Ischnura elegans]